MVTRERAAEWLGQYERLRQHALCPVGPGEGWGLVTLLRSGMAAWLQALMAGSRSAETASSNPSTTLPMAAVERDWVLALAALVLSPTDRREVHHG